MEFFVGVGFYILYLSLFWSFARYFTLMCVYVVFPSGMSVPMRMRHKMGSTLSESRIGMHTSVPAQLPIERIGNRLHVNLFTDHPIDRTTAFPGLIIYYLPTTQIHTSVCDAYRLMPLECELCTLPLMFLHISCQLYVTECVLSVY